MTVECSDCGTIDNTMRVFSRLKGPGWESYGVISTDGCIVCRKCGSKNIENWNE
ncbi:MAG: hypothetical protein ACFFEA_12580 [Candidatus Thorarchaeota archaeon]